MSILIKTLFYLIFAIIFVLFTSSFLKNSWHLINAGKRISQAKKNLSQLKKENQKLWSKLKYCQSDEFIEGQIRDKLQMAKLGETVVVLPSEINQIEESSVSAKIAQKKMANWQKWLNLFWLKD